MVKGCFHAPSHELACAKSAVVEWRNRNLMINSYYKSLGYIFNLFVCVFIEIHKCLVKH